MGNHFVAIDVETANASRASICQIGMVAFDGTTELWRWSSLLDPEEGFESRNVGIHRIHPRQVIGAPRFPAVLQATRPSMEGQCVVSWSDFDQDAVTQAASKYEAAPPQCCWLDVCEVARHVWPDLPNHKLPTVASAIGIIFDHHDALADAWACAQIFIAAMQETETSVEDWLGLIKQNQAARYTGRKELAQEVECALEGKVDGPLAGHVLLLTGSFTEGKMGFARMASSLGCTVKTGFSKKITLLVVGHRDPDEFGGVEKSTKHRQAEEAQQAGQTVAILTEQQFMDWVAGLEQEQQTA